MRLLIDLDDTLVDLMTKACYYHRKLYGSNIYKEDLTKWDLPGDHREWEAIFRIPGFYADLPWIDDYAKGGLYLLFEQGYDLRIVSSPVTWEAAHGKYSWVHTNLVIPGILPSMSHMVLTRDKSIIRGDMLIDDGVHNHGHHAYSVVYGRPWNTSTSLPRGENWVEVVAHVQDIKERLDVAWRGRG